MWNCALLFRGKIKAGPYLLYLNEILRGLKKDRKKKMIFGTPTDSWYPRKRTPGCCPSISY